MVLRALFRRSQTDTRKEGAIIPNKIEIKNIVKKCEPRDPDDSRQNYTAYPIPSLMRVRHQALEWEFYMTAALMSSIVGDFPEGQAEALRLQLPQLLWKVRLGGKNAAQSPNIIYVYNIIYILW